jgi:hypothetical protein
LQDIWEKSYDSEKFMVSGQSDWQTCGLLTDTIKLGFERINFGNLIFENNTWLSRNWQVFGGKEL